MVASIKTRKDFYDCYTDIDTTVIKSISDKVVEYTGSVVQNNKAVVGKNAFRHEAGIHQAGVLKNIATYEIMRAEDYGVYGDNIVLGIHSGKTAIINKMSKMQKKVSDYDIESIVDSIKEYFESSDTITDSIFNRIVDQNKKSVVI